jgi:Fe-S-cluster-containing dehydrogenase component
MKKILLDMDLCVGCGACAVACMDQNDINLEAGEPAERRIYQTEFENDGKVTLQFVSQACRHCDDSPCVTGCPTGALSRDAATGAVLTNRDLCIGCHSCAIACPFGVPRYDKYDRIFKCTLCAGRVKCGLKPACVRVCPTEALKFDEPNNAEADKEAAYIRKTMTTTRTTAGYVA